MFFFIWMHSAMLTTSQLSTHYTSTKYNLSSYYHLILFCYTPMKICHIEIIKKLKGQEWSRHYLKMYRKTLICQRKLNTTTLYPFNLKFSYKIIFIFSISVSALKCKINLIFLQFNRVHDTIPQLCHKSYGTIRLISITHCCRRF